MKILVISPFLGTSGSEIAIINLINVLSEKISFTIYLDNQRIKSDQFRNLNINFLVRENVPVFNKLIKNLYSKRSDKFYTIRRFLTRSPQSYVLFNTLLSVKFINQEIFLDHRVIFYVHETELMLVHLNKEKLDFILNRADLILCSSVLVKNYFSVLGRDNQIEVLYPAVNFEKFCLPREEPQIRNKIGFSKENFVWGMSGALLTNKNPRSFIRAAIKTIDKFPEARFVWIGVSGNNAYEEFIRRYITKKKLDKHIVFIEKKTKDYFQYLNCIDALLLTSFSESFSLVALEAAAFNKTVVSFPCGGILESVPERFRKVTSNFSEDELVELMEYEMKSLKKELLRTEINHIFKNDQFKISKRFLEILNEN